MICKMTLEKLTESENSGFEPAFFKCLYLLYGILCLNSSLYQLKRDLSRYSTTPSVRVYGFQITLRRSAFNVQLGFKSYNPTRWAMVLGSFQCRGVLLLLHIVGQGLAVLAAGAGRVGYIFHLSSLSNALSFGNMTVILRFRLLNPNGSCQLLPRTSSLSTG